MSKKADFVNGVLRGSRIGGGSKKTLHDRSVILTAFCHWLWDAGYQLLSIDSIRVCHVSDYISARYADGLNLRTLQNMTSAIRAALRGSGRVAFANSQELSNKALGINGASRKGTKRPISDLEYAEIYKRAMDADAGLAAVFGLERRIGLRGREAVMSSQSLPDWVRLIDAGASKITVVHGTKGKKARETTLHHRDDAVSAIKFAARISKSRGGVLIAAKNLGAALGYYHRNAHKIGLQGEIAPHSLRYAYACDAVEAYMRQDYSEREAHALAAMDLGHGSGRGRLIREIYGRKPKQG